MPDFSKLSDAKINYRVAKALGFKYSGGVNINGVRTYYLPNGVYFGPCPDYCNEADAYMPLVEKMKPCTFYSHDLWRCFIPMDVSYISGGGKFYSVNKSLGRAVCECFLQWHEAQGKVPPC